jgi:hypothetical protein
MTTDPKKPLQERSSALAEADMSEYIAGFDAGCDYICHEIERWIKRHDYEPRMVGPILTLLAHLKHEQGVGKTPRK